MKTVKIYIEGEAPNDFDMYDKEALYQTLKNAGAENVKIELDEETE